jgi:cardiolipin synthase A/B
VNVFAWIGVGIVTLLVVTLAYVGMLYLTRSVHISRISSLGDNAAEPHEKEFPRLISLLTGADLAEGHKVEVFTCGDDTYPRLWADMRSAERSLTVQMYYCQPGTVADQCADILVERARAGVKVHFMRDGFGGQNLSEEYLQRLEDAGVKVRAPPDPPPLPHPRRLHRRPNRLHRRLRARRQVAWRRPARGTVA